MKLTFPNFEKQVRFAASKALNNAAFEIRRELQRSARRKFIVRNQWTERGFRVKKARARELEAEVGSTREYLVDHVTSGTREAAALPTRRHRGRPRRTIGRGRWPRALLNDKSRYFLAKNRRGGRTVYRRMGRRGRGSTRALWHLPTQAQRIPQRWRFVATARPVFERSITRDFPRQLARALATAR